MSVSELLASLAAGPETSENFLTDGVHACAYRDVPARLDAIDSFLSTHGVDGEAAVAVETGNFLEGALLLLALLRGGRSFAIFPPSLAADIKPAPRFCAHRIRVVPPEFQVEANPGFNGKPSGQAKIYLRTSGSMGASKIVVHDHARMLGNAANCVRKYGFSATTRAAIPVPIAHMYGFGAEFLPSILAGSSIDLQEKTNLLKYLDREKQFQPAIVFATPAICEMLYKGYKRPRAHYQAFVTSGQRIGEDLFRAFDPLVGGRLINQYGSTEMGATAACNPGDSLDLRAQTIGTPMPGVELKLDPAADGQGPADLRCRHPYGFEGYLDEDGEWLLRIRPEDWYRTGDLAVEGPDGSIRVVGRADASVNRRGYLVLLSDIERILERLPAVQSAAVVAAGDGRQGEAIVAFCVANPDHAASPDVIRRACFDAMPAYAVPDEIRAIPAMPLLPSGKTDRRALAMLASGHSAMLAG